MDIFDQLYNLFWQLMDYIADLWYTFINWITQSFANTLTWLQNAFAATVKFIQDSFKYINDLMLSLRNGLIDFVEELVDAIRNAFIQAWNVVRDAVAAYLQELGVFAANLFANIRAQISTIVQNIGVVWGQFIDRVEQVVAGILDAIVFAYNEVVAHIRNGLQLLIDGVTGMLQRAEAVVTSTLQGLISGPAAVFEQLSTRFNDIGTALRSKLDEVVATLGEFPTAVQQTIDEMVDKLLKGLLEWTNAPELNGVMGSLTQLVSTGGQPVQYQRFMEQIFGMFSPQSTLARGVVFILLTAVAAVPALLNVATVYAQPMIQQLAHEFPYALLAPPDVVTAWRKGFISQSEAVTIIRKQGFSASDAQVMLGLSEAVPTEDVALALWHRGVMTEAQVNDAMSERGFTTVWQNRFKEASFVIPPVADLIVMAVREVFSPEVAQRFGQFDDFPEDLAVWARKQGLTEEWAQRYWAAHWGLPSATQGFEMLHRGVINKDDLNLLLRSLDVMPFWRDRLTQIAYLPYTRVDIRRMHQLGVLTDEDVMRAHLDLGYEPEKAERLTAFVLRLNRSAPGESDEELGRLSRTAILAFYGDGLLTRARAIELLVSLGITSEAASLYLDSVDADEERAERKAETDIIIAQAEAGAITFAEAQDRLNALGLETREVEKALTRLSRSEKAKVQLPSRADGERFFNLGILSTIGYKDLLLRLGYPPNWADLFVQAASIERKINVEQS